MTEAQYQSGLMKRIKKRFPGCVVLKNDAAYQQGIPDWTIFFGPKWATLEVKASEGAREQPNQRHFVQRLDSMGFSAFIYPENEEDVLLALEQAFAS